jgi:hypothetical protein
MSQGKKALSAMAGLFLYLLFPLCHAHAEGLSLSGDTGTLWVQEDGAAGYWWSGIEYRGKSGEPFYSRAGLGRIVSDLPLFSGTGEAMLAEIGVDAAPAGIRLTAGFFQQSFWESNAGGVSLYNEGGNGSFFSAALPFYIGDITITPSYLQGNGTGKDGSFYWFFGKPVLPDFHGFGVSAAYRQQHTLNLYHLSLDMDILSPEDAALFDAHSYCFAAYYTFQAKGWFQGSLGWLTITGEGAGALTSSNQHYSLFPYLFYEASGSLLAHSAFGAVDMRYTRGIFQYHLTLGAAHIFEGYVFAHTHYKKKKIFGGEEAIEDMKLLNADGVGAAFLLLDFGIHHKASPLAFGIKKLFVLPWGYERLSGNTGAGPSSASRTAMSTELLRTILLSGLSCYISASF